MSNYLFVMATNDLEIRSTDPANEDGDSESIGRSHEPTNEVGSDDSFSTRSPHEPTPRVRAVMGTSTPIRISSDTADRRGQKPEDDVDESFSYFSNIRNPPNRILDTPDRISFTTLDVSQMNMANPPKNNWKKKDEAELKYGDDILSTEHLAITSAYNIFSIQKTEAILHAKACQRFFRTVKDNANSIGMKVNNDKTSCYV